MSTREEYGGSKQQGWSWRRNSGFEFRNIPKLFYSKPHKSLTLPLFLSGSGKDTSLKKWVLMVALELCPWLEFFFSSSSIWRESYLSSSSEFFFFLLLRSDVNLIFLLLLNFFFSSSSIWCESYISSSSSFFLLFLRSLWTVKCEVNPKHIPAESLVSAGICQNTSEWLKCPGTSRILTQGGTKGILVPNYIPVWEIPSVPARMERNS